MSPHVLKNVRIMKFSGDNRVHLRLSELSESAHRATASGEAAGVNRIEEQVDQLAAKLWDLTGEELAEVRASLAERG